MRLGLPLGLCQAVWLEDAFKSCQPYSCIIVSRSQALQPAMCVAVMWPDN